MILRYMDGIPSRVTDGNVNGRKWKISSALKEL